MTLRNQIPARSAVAAKPSYGDYREELRTDFNGSCGYCDDSDERIDRIGFHIDHFAPKRKFPHLATAYGNLVYACRFCNMHKSNKWHGDDPDQHNDGSAGFVDPCSTAYDDHLARTTDGRIVGTTDLGRYIARELNLGLLRHELLWRARKARSLRAEIDPLIVRYREAGLPKAEAYIGLLERAHELTLEIERYELQSVHG